MSSAQPRRILLVDADAFFVAVARLVDPEGAGRVPLLIVGGSPEGRGVVCSASYETRAFGVRSAMPMARAIRLCPGATIVPVPRRACGQKSREIRRVLERYSPVVEGASIDEWYLDLSGTEAVYGGRSLDEVAREIRDAVKAETDLSVSIGGGTTKLVAKLAVELAKPGPGGDGVHVVEAGAEADFMLRFAVEEIPFVGPKFRDRLHRLGMHTVRDVRAHDVATLTAWLGERDAHWIADRALGLDDEAVVGERERQKSISREETFATDLGDDASLRTELLRLVTRVAADLREDGLAARTVTVRIRDGDFTTRQASRTLDEAVVSDRVIHATARELLKRLRANRRVPARLLGVSLSGLADAPGGAQLGLFGEEPEPTRETERDRALASAVDRLRARFGDGAIVPAGLVRPDREDASES